ncbi:hypothetical protein LCGC14_2805110, partial [marine sediment metagenome]
YMGRDGENCIRIIEPYEYANTGYWGYDTYYHYPVGPNNDYYLCMVKMVGTPCHPCIKRNTLWEGPDEDRDLAKTLYPSFKQLMWVLDLLADPEKGEDPDQPLYFACPKTLAQEIMAQSYRKGSNTFIVPCHPTEGRPVFYDREGKGKQTKYSNVQFADEATELHPDLWEQIDWFENILDYPEFGEVRDKYEGVTTTASRGDDSPTEEQPADTGEDVVLPECHGVEFGKYQDCEDCEVVESCAEETEASKQPKSPPEEPGPTTGETPPPKTAKAPRRLPPKTPVRRPAGTAATGDSAPASKKVVKRVQAKPTRGGAATSAGGEDEAGEVDRKKIKDRLKDSIAKRKQARG